MGNIFKILITITLLCSGCESGISDKNLRFIDANQAADLMREGESSLLGAINATILVDPRPTWSFRKSHIKNATNIPFGRLYYQAWQLDEAGTIIVAGETYNDPIAVAMSKELIKIGFTDVKTLRGGLTGWEDAGEMVITGE